MTVFQLDPRLDADTLPVMELALCSVRLMNDRRWPWLILVPRIPGASELHDLADTNLQSLSAEVAIAGRALKRLTDCEKINTAAIGNIVRQLHVHVIARSQGDANWPGPVWGFGARVPYDAELAAAVIDRIQSELLFENGTVS